MTDTTLHNLCKGFGALLSRSKVRCVTLLGVWCGVVPFWIVVLKDCVKTQRLADANTWCPLQFWCNPSGQKK